MLVALRPPFRRVIGTLCAAFSLAGFATAASVGDVAVISFASDDPDAIAFVALREIPAGTVLRFTDSGWQASGSFRANEGGVQYTAPGTLAAGTVVSRTNPFSAGGWTINNTGLGAGGFSLATSGDQVLTFIGDASSPTFLHAVDFDSAGYVDALDSNTTGLPPGLTVGTSAVNLGEFDNGYYNGPTTGTPTDLLAAIATPANWTTSDSALSPPGWTFTIEGEGPLVEVVAVPGASFSIGATPLISVTLSEAPAPGSPVTVELSSGAFAADEFLVISNPDTGGDLSVSLVNEGLWSVSATAVSGASGSAVSADFTVGNPLIPPTADAGPDRSVALEASSVTVALADALGDDADGLAGASYAWTPVSAPGLVSWQNRTGPLATQASPADALVTLNAIGVYTLTLTITDDDGLIATDTIDITVSTPAPEGEFDPPAGYYNAATGQGATLMAQLAQILTTGHDQQNYGDFRFNAAYYDADPAIPGNILLVYSRASVPGFWDSGATWDREHVWPQSLQPGSASNSSTGNLGDPHALRPVNPSINGARGNKPFGTYGASGAFGDRGIYWFPGEQDKGDVARSLFYSATRYMSTLTLVNGDPSGNTMGDLASLVRWHYTDVPDYFELRRNHRIFEDQNNRSAYVDRPEFVWSVFGDGANDSTLYVSEVEPLDGVSSINVDLPAIIIGGPLPATVPVTLSKAGDDPTYFLVQELGDADSSITGRFNAFDFGPQQRSISVGIDAPTSAAGVLSGTVLIDNLDVSTQGAGQGSADGDDLIQVTLTVHDHSNASFSASADENTLTLDFGSLAPSAGVQSIPFAVHNLESLAGPTARLTLVSVTPAGDAALLTTDLAPFADLAAGGNAAFSAGFDPSAAAPGDYSATYTLAVADENLPGGGPGTALVLTVLGTIAVDCPADLNDDGMVDIDDLLTVLGAFGVNAGGDTNGDGNTDIDDLLTILGAFGTSC